MTDYEKVWDFGNLYKAYKKSRKGKRTKQSVARFEVDLLENLTKLQQELQDKTYTISQYHCFKVYEPKERLVMANAFRDKVVQHSLCDNVIEPILQRSFIKDNYAVQVGKGTHFGLDRVGEFMRRYFFRRKAAEDERRKLAGEEPLPTAMGNYADGWILKCDVGKYFYSIPHDKLMATIRKHIQDPDVLWLIELIIDSTADPGIPIGNQTSQWFSILYLSDMDHRQKEQPCIGEYGRYVDDFLLIHESKEYLQRCRREIEAHVADLGLHLNSKTNIFPLKNGVDFLGFHTYLTDTGKVIRKVRRNSKEKEKRKLKTQGKAVDEGRLPLARAEDSYQAWRNHASHGNSYHLLRETDALYTKYIKEGKQRWHNF